MRKITPGILIGLVFAVLMYSSMTWGPWAYNDSSAYVSAARNFASSSGNVIQHTTGKVKLLTEFPPFYPIFLSIFGGINGNYISIIRWLNAILFGLTILFFHTVTYQISENFLTAALSTLLFASFKYIIEIYAGAMSETLFFFLLFFAFLLLVLYLKGVHRTQVFILLTLISALLPVTRYAGILFVGVIWVTILFFDQEIPFRKRLPFAMGYLVFAYLPIGLWALSLINRYNKFAGKSFIFQWSFFKSFLTSLANALRVASQWIPYVSEYSNHWISSLLIILCAISIITLFVFPFIWFIKDHGNKRSFKLAFYLSINLMLVGYLALIAFMHSTSSPPIDIIDRTILPLYPLLLLSAMSFISLLKRDQKHRAFSIILIFLSTIVLRYNFFIGRPYLRKLSLDGIGYTSRQFQTSGLLEAINNLNPDRILISNLSGFVLFHTNRYPILIENFPHYRYGDGGSYGEREFREENAALIIFHSEFRNFYGDFSDDLYKMVTESLIVEFQDDQGVILSYDPSIQR